MKLQRVTSLAKADLKKMIREPGMLFLLVLFPLVLTLLFGASFGGLGGGQDTTFAVGVVNLGGEGPSADWSQSFIGNLSGTGVLELTHYSDNQTAHEDLSEGDLQAVLVIPGDFGESVSSFRDNPEDPDRWIYTTLGLSVDSGSMTASQAVPPIVQQVLTLTLYGDRATPQSPIRVGSPSLVEADQLTMFDYFVPGLFAFAAIFMIMTVGQSFTVDREKGLLRRIGTTPTSSAEFMLSQVASNMVGAVIQVVVIFAMAFLMGYRPLGGLGALVMAFVIVLVFSVSCVGFGLITATLAKDPGAATGIAFIFIMPQMFLGTYVSVAISSSMQAAGRFVPSWYVTDALTSLFLRGASITSSKVLLDLVVVVVVSIAVFLAGVLLFEKRGTG
jgi:ABC-type multidrug transport system permease subunit